MARWWWGLQKSRHRYDFLMNIIVTDVVTGLRFIAMLKHHIMNVFSFQEVQNMNDEIQNMEDVEVFFKRANSTEVILWVLYM